MTSLVRDENRSVALGAESTLSRKIIPAKIRDSSERLLTETNIVDSTDTIIDPATSDNQTNGEQTTKLNDEYGNDIEGTMLNQLKVAQNYRLSGGVFNGVTLDSNFYTSVLASNGTVTVSNTEAILTTTADSGSSSGIYANSLARYMGANMNYYRAVLKVGDIGIDNNTRRWGVCNILPIVDGYFFQLSGTTFSIVKRKAGNNTVVNSGSFNGKGSSTGGTYTIDTNYHTFEIYYTNKRVMFVIDGTPIHTSMATTTSLCGTQHLRPFFDNTNTGVGSVVTSSCMVMTISRYGTPNSQAKTYFQQGTTAGVLLKNGPGSLHLANISAVVNNSVITLYDGASTSGVVLWSSGTMGAQTQPFGLSFDGAGGTLFNTGLFLTITGANSNVFVKYE